MALELLSCIGWAVVKNAPRMLLSGLPFGETLYDIARDVLAELEQRRKSAAELRQEVEALAQADPAEVRRQAQAVAKAKAPPELQAKLSDYLERLPGVIRRSLSRPDDPRGCSVPARLPLSEPEDLIPFLPFRPSPFRPGDQPKGINGWVLQELLGFGGFGEVWLAHNGSGDQAALKFCLDEMAMHSLDNERKLLQRVQHENQGNTGLVELLDYYLDVETPCLVFSYVPGGDLTRLIRCWHESRPSPTRLGRETVRLLRRLAEILCCAHQLNPPVVHRDLKPSNILLQPKENCEAIVSLRITDFGIGGLAAQASSQRSTSQSTKLRGAYSELYSSPQQRAGHRPSPSDDIYALGVIGYQTLTGDIRVAPDRRMKKQLGELQIPEKVSDLLAECLMQEGEDRPANAALLLPLLKTLLEELPKPEKAARSV